MAANVLERRFDVKTPNKIWTADLRYVWTYEGWLYLAVVMDLHSRQIVGWAMKDRMKKQLAIDALAMAYCQRKPAKGLLHHSDRGSQYACHDYQKQLNSYGVQVIDHYKDVFMLSKSVIWAYNRFTFSMINRFEPSTIVNIAIRCL